jgi:hypothetical protein
MGFFMNTVVSLPPTMQPTRTDENLGEWEEKIRGLAVRGVKNKKAFVKSANCSWRVDGIDWYTNDYYYKRIKYVLYYDEYFCLRGSRNAVYRLSLVDITSSCFHSMRQIAEYSGVLVSPLMIYHFRMNSRGMR